MRRIVLSLSIGYSTTEIARSLAITRSSVQRLIDELAAELERQPPEI